MIVGSPRAAAFAPPAKAAILLVAFYFSVSSQDFVTLIYRPFEIGRCYPIVMKIDAHPVIEIDANLDCIVGVNPVAFQSLLLANGRQRYRLALVIMPDQIDPM